MADPIEHDSASTVATAATSSLKWGLLGAIASFAIPALVVGGLLSLLPLGIIATGLAVVGGLAAGVAGAVYAGVPLTIGGSLVGLAKGGQQVSDETHAAHRKVRGYQGRMTKKFNDGEVLGIQEGYQLARNDMAPQVAQREQMAYQKGQSDLMHQIHDHMAAQQAAETHKPESKFADKVVCKCESKAEAIIKERETQAAMPNQIT